MSDEFYFDPEQQEGSSFEPIPKGEYTAEIIEAEIRQPRSGDGHMLALIWKIIDGDQEGRQVWDTLCYQHSNQTTQDIARRKLKDLCTALAITEQVTDPEVFKFKSVRVRIGIQSDKYGQYDDKNRINRILPLQEAQAEALEAASSKPAKPAAAQPAGAAPKPAPKPTNGPGAAPWKRPAA
jgi:hypothetical protein